MKSIWVEGKNKDAEEHYKYKINKISAEIRELKRTKIT